MITQENIMTFTVETDAHAVIVVFASNFNLQREAEALREALWDALDAQAKSVALIFDTSDAKISAKDLIISTDDVSRSLLQHENVRETIVITDDALVKMAARGMNSVSFGFIKVSTYPTLRDALSYLRNQDAYS